MEWEMRWVSSAGNLFNKDFGATTEQGEQHGFSVFFRRGDEIFRTYFTTARGLETVGGIWSLLDLTPSGGIVTTNTRRRTSWRVDDARRSSTFLLPGVSRSCLIANLPGKTVGDPRFQ
jgi:predicted dithiol-disulfide oxidoreductase (DUF899 family)